MSGCRPGLMPTLVAVAALVCAGCSGDALPLLAANAVPPTKEPAADKEAVLKPIYTVEEVTVRVMESYPEQLHIEARGSTRTGGWTDPQLRLQRSSGSAGRYEFQFVARPLDGVAMQAIMPIRAVKTMQKPADYRGVIVFAETNSKEAR